MLLPCCGTEIKKHTARRTENILLRGRDKRFRRANNILSLVINESFITTICYNTIKFAFLFLHSCIFDIIFTGICECGIGVGMYLSYGVRRLRPWIYTQQIFIGHNLSQSVVAASRRLFHDVRRILPMIFIRAILRSNCSGGSGKRHPPRRHRRNVHALLHTGVDVFKTWR